jgi:hypothetical protein
LSVTAPTNLALASGTEYNFISSGNVEIRRLRVAWTATADPFVSDYVVQFKRSSDGTYTTYTQTADTLAFIAPVALGETYDVRVCARNQLGRRSDYVTVLRHTVSETYVSADGGTTSSVTGTGSSTSVSGTGWST